MLSRKTHKLLNAIFKKVRRTPRRAFCLIPALSLCFLMGCGNASDARLELGDTETGPQISKQGASKEESGSEAGQDMESMPNVDAEKITECYREIYNAAGADGLGSLDVAQSIVERLGENGYIAVDSENQVDMAGADSVMQFCKQVDEKKTAEITILAVNYMGGFVKYDLRAEGGEVNVTSGQYQYENGIFENLSAASYPADVWRFTDEGYLLFEGNYYSESYYVLALNDVPEHVALRVQPLKEGCREMNRKCIFLIGYGKNNLFLTDWNEGDFGELNFYDAYDRLYPILKGAAVPYVMDDDYGVGAVYQLPKDAFEEVIFSYFHIDSETLQSKASYSSESETYEYKPRGFQEMDYADIPYPEVVDYEENSDGTITLTVNAVYPNENASKAFAHETVIRPLSDGGFQYVSNRMLTPKEDGTMWWHSERLTEEAWEKVYEN